MAIVLSHDTALAYWQRCTFRRNRLRPAPLASGATERLAWSPQLAAELAQLGIRISGDDLLHLLFADQKLRPAPDIRSLPPIRAHVQNALLPAGSVLRLSEQVGIVSPEVCFLQMADTLSLP